MAVEDGGKHAAKLVGESCASFGVVVDQRVPFPCESAQMERATAEGIGAGRPGGANGLHQVDQRTTIGPKV